MVIFLLFLYFGSYLYLFLTIMKFRHLSDKERQDMGMRGYEYVMKYHSVPVLASKLLEVLEN